MLNLIEKDDTLMNCLEGRIIVPRLNESNLKDDAKIFRALLWDQRAPEEKIMDFKLNLVEGMYGKVFYNVSAYIL